MTAEPDFGGLREFARTRDRRLTPFFVGRAAVLDDIEWTCGQALRDYRSGRRTEDATRLIQGAPGAGKTAILGFLEDKWNARRRDGDRTAPVAVRLAGQQLASWDDLFLHMEGKLPAGPLARFFGRFRNHLTVKLNLPFLEISGTSEGTSASVDDFTAPVCLMVDEVQSLKSDGTGNVHDDVKEIFSVLHLGTHGLPVVPVLAGLAYSRDRLREAGLSRLPSGAVHTLPALSPVEACRSVELFLDHFRVRGEAADRERWSERIATDSQGWPQHLHTALNELAAALAEREGDLACLDVGTVRAAMRERREEYYHSRLSPACRRSIGLLGTVSGKMRPDGESPGSVIRLIQRCHRDDEPEWSLPEDMTAAGFYDEMLRVGILQDDDGIVSHPIPSFRAWLVGRAVAAGREGGGLQPET